MELDSIRIAHIKNITDSLLCKIVTLVKPSGGFSSFQLFKKCTVDVDKNGEWYVEIDAHDDALPLMFQFKERYFTYQLWNALRLKSSNQLRMYEILKQYEHIGERVISIDELRDLLGIERLEYPRFNSFRERVIDACQKALEEHTDIKFTYEPYGKLGKGGKILNLKFTIFKNTGYKDQLSLDAFIAQQEMAITKVEDNSTNQNEESYFTQEIYPFMSDACDNEFSQEEIQVLYNLVVKAVPYRSKQNHQTEIYDYLKRKYDELKWRASTTKITRRLGYLKKIIEADLDQ